MWSLPDLSLLRTQTFSKYVYGLAYDPLNSNILVGDGDGFIQVVSLTLEPISKFKIHKDLVVQILLSTDKIISSSLDYTVKVVNKDTFQVVQVFNLAEPVWNIRLFSGILYISLSQSPSVSVQNPAESQPLKYALTRM